MTEAITFLPRYDPCPEYNAELLRQSIPLMMKYRVSAHPINYAVWYEYSAGTNAKLKTAVDSLIENKQPFSENISFDLFKSYVCNVSVESYEKINEDLLALIENINSAVQDSSTRVGHVGANVQAGSLKLEQVNDLSDVKEVLSDIVAETRQLLDISNSLKTKLNEANHELASMRDELTKVRELASTDPLTGLLNRRVFDQTLNELVTQTQGSENCLLLLDLDHFKKINDHFGHLIGDKVLRYTAKLLRKYTLSHHYVARYGGEELAVIMPDTVLDKALAIAEKIRQTLANSQLKQKGGDLAIGKVTLSIGGALLKPNDSVESLIARADAALYSAKENGRNRVVFAD